MFERKGMGDFPHCQWCGWSKYVFLHHNTPTKSRSYDSWQQESEDVIILCQDCHLHAHDGNWKKAPNSEKFYTKKRALLTPDLLQLMQHRDKLVDIRASMITTQDIYKTQTLYKISSIYNDKRPEAWVESRWYPDSPERWRTPAKGSLHRLRDQASDTTHQLKLVILELNTQIEDLINTKYHIISRSIGKK
jgi:hypothetical protein